MNQIFLDFSNDLWDTCRHFGNRGFWLLGMPIVIQPNLAEQGLPVEPPPAANKIEVPQIQETKWYVWKIFTTPMSEVNEFIVPLGQGSVIIQRIRVELTRRQKELRAAGKTVLAVKLRSDIVDEHANRRTIIKMWKEQKGQKIRKPDEIDALFEDLKKHLNKGE